MQKRSEKGKLPVHVIAMASIGDKEAMNAVFEQYDGLISYILINEIRSWQLNIKLVPVEDMLQQVRADLVKAVRKFTIRCLRKAIRLRIPESLYLVSRMYFSSSFRYKTRECFRVLFVILSSFPML